MVAHEEAHEADHEEVHEEDHGEGHVVDHAVAHEVDLEDLVDVVPDVDEVVLAGRMLD